MKEISEFCIDRIKIYNVVVKEIESISNIRDFEEVTINQNNCTMADKNGECFSKINLKEKYYNFLMKDNIVVLEIFSRNENGTNLFATPISEMYQLVLKIKEILHDKYGISVELTDAHIGYIEITKDIWLENDIKEYARVVKGLGHVIEKVFRMKYRECVANCDDENGSETIYLKNKNKKYECAMYNKTEQERKKGNSVTANVLRIEFRYKSGGIIRSKFGSNRIEMLNVTINQTINELLNRILQRISSSLNKYDRQREEFVINEIEKTKVKDFADILMFEAVSYESENEYPIVFDLKEVETIIDNYYKKNPNRRVEKKRRKNSLAAWKEKHQNSIFLDDGEMRKYQELINKFINNNNMQH